jgi:hypothetical protein
VPFRKERRLTGHGFRPQLAENRYIRGACFSFGADSILSGGELSGGLWETLVEGVKETLMFHCKLFISNGLHDGIWVFWKFFLPNPA